MTEYIPPSGLSVGALEFWKKITDEYDLGTHELRVLEDCCKQMEIVDRLAEALENVEILTRGSQGQPVVHPLVSEIRQSRAALSTLMGKMNLPTDDEPEGDASANANPARAMANQRWKKSRG